MWKSYTVLCGAARQQPPAQQQEGNNDNDINLDPTTFSDMIDEINDNTQQILELNTPAPKNHIVDQGTDNEENEGDDPTYVPPDSDGDDETCQPKRRKIAANQSDDEAEVADNNDNTADKSRTTIEQFKCHLCKETFISISVLCLHLKTKSHLELERQARLNEKLKNQQQGQTEQSQLGTGISTTTIADSMKRRRLYCQLCNLFCRHPSDMKKHLKTLKHLTREAAGNPQLPTPSSSSSFRCTFCNTTFTRKIFLKVHTQTSKIHRHNLFLFKSQHTPQEFEAEVQKLETSLERQNLKFNSSCSVCNLNFWSSARKRAHDQTQGHKANVKLLRDGPPAADIDDDDDVDNDDTDHELSTSRKEINMIKEAKKTGVFMCNICQICTSLNGLKCHFHYRRHKYKSREILLGSPSSSSALPRRAQRGQGNFKCNICNTRFQSKKSCNRHIRVKHAGQENPRPTGSGSAVEINNDDKASSVSGGDSGADSSDSSPDEAEQVQLQACIMKNKHDHACFKCEICDTMYYYDLELKLHAKTAKHIARVKALEKFRAESQVEENQGLSLEQLKEKRRKVRKEKKQKQRKEEAEEESYSESESASDSKSTRRPKHQSKASLPRCQYPKPRACKTSFTKSSHLSRRYESKLHQDKVGVVVSAGADKDQSDEDEDDASLPITPLKQENKAKTKTSRERRRHRRGAAAKKRLSKKVKEWSSEEDELHEENDINWSEEDSSESESTKTKTSKRGRGRPPERRKGQGGNIKLYAKTIDKELKKEVAEDEQEEENQTELIEIKTEDDNGNDVEESAQDPFIEGV